MQVSNTKLNERYGRTIRLPNGRTLSFRLGYFASHVEFTGITADLDGVVWHQWYRRGPHIPESTLAASQQRNGKLPPRYNRTIQLPNGKQIRFFAYAVNGEIEVFVLPEDVSKCRCKRFVPETTRERRIADLVDNPRTISLDELRGYAPTGQSAVSHYVERQTEPKPDALSVLGKKLADVIEEYAVAAGHGEHPIMNMIKEFRAEMKEIDAEDDPSVVDRYLEDNPERDPDDSEFEIGALRPYTVRLRRESVYTLTLPARSALEAEALAFYTEDWIMDLESSQTVFMALYPAKQ
jgi:hypothetical protein